MGKAAKRFVINTNKIKFWDEIICRREIIKIEMERE